MFPAVPAVRGTSGLLESTYERGEFKVASFFKEKIGLVKVFGDGEEADAEEVEDVSEHLVVAVDEVVLLEAVEDDEHAAAAILGRRDSGYLDKKKISVYFNIKSQTQSIYVHIAYNIT